MNKLIEFINDRINHYIKSSDVINATPAIVTEVFDGNWATAKLLCNEATYKLRNLSGAVLKVGDSCQVYYKKSLMQSNSYIGAAQPNGGLVYLYLTPKTGAITASSKEIAKLQFVSDSSAVALFSFTGEFKGTEATDIELKIILDEESVNSFSQTLSVDGKETVGVHLPLSDLEVGEHTISVVCNGHCNVVNLAAFVYGTGLTEAEQPVLLPLYRLADNSEDLPLISGEGFIPNALAPDVLAERFVARADTAYIYQDDPMVWSENNSIYVAHGADIRHSVVSKGGDQLAEFTIKFKYSGLQRDSVVTPRYGYEFMYAKDINDTGYLDVMLDEDDNYFVIVLQRGYGAPTLDVSGHNTGTTANGVKFNDIDFDWLANDGEGREFKVCLKDNVVYFYIDDVLFCHQDYHSNKQYETICVGTRYVPHSVYGGYGTPTMKIDNFEIYDE